jgi:hypothetical protein
MEIDNPCVGVPAGNQSFHDVVVEFGVDVEEAPLSA